MRFTSLIAAFVLVFVVPWALLRLHRSHLLCFTMSCGGLQHTAEKQIADSRLAGTTPTERPMSPKKHTRQQEAKRDPPGHRSPRHIGAIKPTQARLNQSASGSAHARSGAGLEQPKRVGHTQRETRRTAFQARDELEP